MNTAKYILVLGLVSAAPLFAQHEGHMMSVTIAASSSDQIMMAMHAPMMAQPAVTGVHPDISYLENMIPHHQGAVDSSKLILKLSKNKEIRGIAQAIVASQEKEIAAFRKLVADLKKEAPSFPAKQIKTFDARAQKDMTAMMNGMTGLKTTEDIDRDFIAGMVIHHQGAVDSSKQILSVSKDPRVRKAAETIIADQDKEIATFRGILSR